jgi:hypothetical protein
LQALLDFQVDAGDTVLGEHFKKCGKKSNIPFKDNPELLN